MSVMRRLSTIFKAKANKALDKAEDPREILDYSYARQLEQLEKVRRGVADVATSRKRLELQAEQFQASVAKLEGQARDAMALGNDDLAREALTRKAAAADQLTGLAAQRDQLAAEEAKLVEASKRLQAKIEAFRTHKEVIKATYTAAEAETKVGEAVSGISEEMSDVGLAVQRAEDKTAEMHARAGAIDELLASGALNDVTAPADPIQAELDRATATSSVEDDMARLKGELAAPPPPAALEAPKA